MSTIKHQVDALLGSSVTEERKRSIVTSIEAAQITDPTERVQMIHMLAEREHETVLSFTSGLSNCINCKGAMEDVKLHNARPARYCARCRIALPSPIRNS